MKIKAPVITDNLNGKELKHCRSIREFVRYYGLFYQPYEEKINKLHLPNNRVCCSEAGIFIFNEAVRLCIKKFKKPRLTRTKSGGIMRYSACGFGFDHTTSTVTLIYYGSVFNEFDNGFRLTIGGSYKDGNYLTGREAFKTMVSEFKKDGINIYDYAIENGEEVKKTINKPLIDLDDNMMVNKTYKHVNHLDLHSAYPSGLIKSFPELKPTIERIYNNRKNSEKDKDLKLRLDASMGYFQSSYCTAFKFPGKHYVLAHLAKAGVNWCRETIEKLAKELKAQNKQILAYNTDGIWFVDEKNNFHSKLIGDGLGKAGIDHVDCTIRFKSKGAYEFMENGKYKPVVRGYTNLDKIKDRSEWEWGDIYKECADPCLYRWNPETYYMEMKKDYDDQMTDSWLEENFK